MNLTKLSRAESLYADILDRWWELRYSLRGKTFFDIFDDTQQWITCKLHLCNECPHCETYYCWSCMRRVPWEFGCADDMLDLCDDCWAEAHGQKVA